MNFSFSKTKKLGPEYEPKNIVLNDWNYYNWYEELENKILKRN